MTIDEIVERAIPLRGIECPTKKAEAVVRRRELIRNLDAYAKVMFGNGWDAGVQFGIATPKAEDHLTQMETHTKPFI